MSRVVPFPDRLKQTLLLLEQRKADLIEGFVLGINLPDGRWHIAEDLSGIMQDTPALPQLAPATVMPKSLALQAPASPESV